MHLIDYFLLLFEMNSLWFTQFQLFILFPYFFGAKDSYFSALFADNLQD